MEPQKTFAEAFQELKQFTANQSLPLEGTESAANALQRVHYNHDAMIDLLIANPAISQNALAAHFGYTVPWVSRVLNSDAFLARLAERKKDLVDPSVLMTMEEKLKALADKSLEVVMDKLCAVPNPDTALRALELSTKALGYGARQQNLTVQNSFVVAMPSKVVDSGEWAAKHRGQLAAGTVVEEATIVGPTAQ